MQFIFIGHQLLETAQGLILGVLFGFLYDIVRFVRRLMRPLGAEVFIANVLDVLYFLILTASYGIFLYVASFGRFRWFTFAAFVAGFALYRILPSAFIKPFFYFVADRVCDILRILLLPLKILLRAIKRLLLAAFVKSKRTLGILRTKRLKRKLYSDIRL